KNLEQIDVRLLEFRASRRFFGQSLRSPRGTTVTTSIPTIETTVYRDRSNGTGESQPPNNDVGTDPEDPFFIIFKKLELIDQVRDRYDRSTLAAFLATPTVAAAPPISSVSDAASPASSGNASAAAPQTMNAKIQAKSSSDTGKPMASRSSVLPRSLLSTLDRVRRDLDDRSEAEIIENYRTSKARTIVSLKFVLLLILVPLLTQQLCKNFLVGPFVDGLYHPKVEEVFLNPDMEEEALLELEHYEHLLRFRNMAREDHNLNEAEISERIAEKATEIAEESVHASANAIKNVVADLFSIFSFALVVFYSREEVAILKSFIDEIMYGLSDSAKAFVIILSTDIFVGYHSTHGWEVIVGGLSRHFGLP
ncbi:MAG: proton extrusion protein PcxA, partial [Cyanobacteria bacterium P01_H01_bin.130]